MVGRGGRSKRCLSCATRRIKCDEKKPKCSQCKKGGFDCDYPEIGFINSIDPSRESRNPSESASPPNREAGTGITRRNGRALQSRVSIRTITVPDDFYIGYLRTTLFVKSGPSPNNSAVWPGFLAELPAHPLASKCLMSLSQAYFGTEHGDREISIRGTELYGRSLHQLNSSLGNQRFAPSNDTLLAVMILSLYEMLVLSSPTGWIEHALGLGRMFYLRGPGSFPNQKELMLLESNKFIIILAALASSQATYFSNPVWKTLPWKDCPNSKTQLGYLLDIFADITTLKAVAARHRSDNDISGRIVDIETAIEELKRWRAEWDLLNILNITDVPNLKEEEQKILPVIFEFTSLRHANEMCIYNSAMIQAVRVRRLLSEDIPPVYSDYERQAAIEICKATDYHLVACPWMTAQFHLLFPLRMAELALTGSGNPLQAWIQQRLMHFTGNKRGWGIAHKLDEYGAVRAMPKLPL